MGLTVTDLQQRHGRAVFADIAGKGGRIRTVPVPDWVEAALQSWLRAAGIAEGRIFRAVLAFFAMGIVLVLYPVNEAKNMNPNFPIGGEASSANGQVLVYVAFGPDIIEKDKTKFILTVPFRPDVSQYHVLFVSGHELISHQAVAAVSPGKTVRVPRSVELQ